MATTAETILEIHNLLATYSIAIDTQTFGLLDDVFTPDANIELAATGKFTPAEYVELARGGLARLDGTQHHLGLPAIRVDGERAFSRTYFIAQHCLNSLAPAGTTLVVGGWYDDEWVRVDGAWRISQRIGTAAWYDGNPDVLGLQVPMGGAEASPGRSAPSWLTRR